MLDTLTMLKGAQEALLSSLEEACGNCDSLCEEFAYPDENAEAILQTVPAELLQKLRERGICMRQLARHLRKGDAVYGRYMDAAGLSARLDENDRTLLAQHDGVQEITPVMGGMQL